MIDLVLERGYEEVTVEAVCERAGLGRDAFERQFRDREECFMAVFWHYTGRFEHLVVGAFENEEEWRDGLRAAGWAANRYILTYPRQTRFGSTAMFTAGPVAQAHREAHLNRFVDLIDAGRQELDDPESLDRTVAEGVMGSIYTKLIEQLQQNDGAISGEKFIPELMYIAVRPYLGNEAATEELSMPAPAPFGNGPPG
jgi:AcrR family transcriptional regulator